MLPGRGIDDGDRDTIREYVRGEARRRKDRRNVLREHFCGDGDDKAGFSGAAFADDGDADVGRDAGICSGGGNSHDGISERRIEEFQTRETLVWCLSGF